MDNDLGDFVDRLARGTRTWGTPAAVAAGSMFGAAQAQSAYVCEPGTVPNVSEARTTSAINELEDTIAQNLPNHVPRIAGSDKLVINFEGSGPVTDERIGHDVTFALVNVGTNVMQGDGSSTQRFGMNNEGQYVQTFRIEGDELYGLKNVVESMCVNYEIEIGVRAPDGSVIDASLRHNAGSADAPEIGLIGPRGTDQDGMRIGPDGFVIYGDITPAGTRRIANGKEGMASAVRVDLGELTRDVLLEIALDLGADVPVIRVARLARPVPAAEQLQVTAMVREFPIGAGVPLPVQIQPVVVGPAGPLPVLGIDRGQRASVARIAQLLAPGIDPQRERLPGGRRRCARIACRQLRFQARRRRIGSAAQVLRFCRRTRG